MCLWGKEGQCPPWFQHVYSISRHSPTSDLHSYPWPFSWSVVPCLCSFAKTHYQLWGRWHGKDHIVIFLIKILEAVQTRIKLQKIHKTWSCREQSNQIWKWTLNKLYVLIKSWISHPIQMSADVKDNITDSRYH